MIGQMESGAIHLGFNPERLERFIPHVVAILYYVFPPEGGERKQSVGSGVLFQVGANVWLVTAGHVVKDLRDWNALGRLSHVRLCDSWRDSEGVADPIYLPVKDVDPSAWVIFGTDENPPDLGAIKLQNNLVDQLKAGRVEIIEARDWANIPQQLDFYKLLGSPGQLTNETEVGLAMFRLEKISRPEAAPKTEFDRFYGQLFTNQERQPGGVDIEKIEGVSGGPIIGFKELVNGSAYWIVAIQSTWFTECKIVTADYYLPLLQHLESL
jgi:hypothetical protein